MEQNYDVPPQHLPLWVAVRGRVEEWIGHMPTKAQMYAAGGAALAAVTGVMAKGFGWL